jgi:hypothetical protein
MATRKSSGGSDFMPGKPKKSRQGVSQNTKLSASSRNGARKKYKGQGK